MSANILFQRLESQCHRGRRQIEASCGFSDRAILDHHEKGFEKPRIHPKKNYLLKQVLSIFYCAAGRPIMRMFMRSVAIPAKRQFVHLRARAPHLELEGRAMKLPRRQFLHLAVGAVALPTASRVARAQVYPARPVRIIVGFVAGGPQTIIASLIGQWLSDRLGQPFVIENRPGAGGNIGAEAVVNAPPDGYALLLAGPPNAINTTLYQNLKFNFLRDIAPVAGIGRVPLIVEVNPSVPAKTLSDFIAYARANPGKINMASAGNGTPQHVSGELFKMMARVDMLHVPYRGSAAALTDLLGGQVQLMFETPPASIEYIRTGKLRALAVTTATRSDALPDLPTVGDFVPGYEASSWYAVGAPRDTPAEIVHILNREINGALADPKMKARLADLGATIFTRSPAELGKFITDETQKWAKVIRFAGIKPE